MGRSQRGKTYQAVSHLSRHGANRPQVGVDTIGRRGTAKQERKRELRHDKRSAPAETSWLHGTLFVVLLVIVIAWVLGY
jgi:hypothetical protein